MTVKSGRKWAVKYRKVTKSSVARMRTLYRAGATARQIADIIGCSKATVAEVLNGTYPFMP